MFQPSFDRGDTLSNIDKDTFKTAKNNISIKTLSLIMGGLHG